MDFSALFPCSSTRDFFRHYFCIVGKKRWRDHLAPAVHPAALGKQILEKELLCRGKEQRMRLASANIQHCPEGLVERQVKPVFLLPLLFVFLRLAGMHACQKAGLRAEEYAAASRCLYLACRVACKKNGIAALLRNR